MRLKIKIFKQFQLNLIFFSKHNREHTSGLSGGFYVYSLSALEVIIFITVREIATHKLSQEVPTITVVLSTAIGSAV